MSALVQELPRATAPWCAEAACPHDATVVNFYGHDTDRSYVSVVCDDHHRMARQHCFTRSPFSFAFDYYLPILLATVGDELWISLECWTRQLGEQVRIMAEAVR